MSASEMAFGGQVTASGRTVQSDGEGDATQRGLTLSLDGVGYIWRPWFATARLGLDISQISTELDQEGTVGDQHTDDRILAGEARTNLFPRSRFPLEAFVDIFDSRIQTDTVGVALQDLDTLRRERVGATQHYRTPSGESNYVLQAVRTRVTELDDSHEDSEDLLASGSQRFGSQTLDYRVTQRNAVRHDVEADTRGNQTDQGLTLRHEIQPSEALTVETVYDAAQEDEELAVTGIRQDRQDTASSMDNFTTWRPVGSPWTVRTHLGGQRRDGRTDSLNTRETSSIASVRTSYDITRALVLAMDVGTSRNRRDTDPEVRRTFENASLNYSPAAIALSETVHYHWGASATVGNTNANNARSVQSASVGLRHGVDHIISDDGGRTVTESLNESATEFGDSNDTRLLTLNHQASLSVFWSRVASNTLTQLNLTDTRTRGRQSAALQDEQSPPAIEPFPTATPEPAAAEPPQDVHQVVQTADVYASHQLLVSRFSSWEGNARVGVTRQNDSGVETESTFADASVGYAYRHVFGVDQLRFRSRLEYASHWVDEEDTGTRDTVQDGERRASWDNRLDYIIGLLSLSLSRTVTVVADKYRRIIGVSATRRF